MTSCKKCVHSLVCGKQLMRKTLEPKGYELTCRFFKNKADFVEVKHGYWKHTVEFGQIGKYHHWNCSLCGVVSQDDGREKYCHDCGAKMDRGKAE